MPRLILAVAVLACLSGRAAGQTAPATDGVAALLDRLGTAIQEGPPDRYLDLLSATANRQACAAFSRSMIVPGITRAVVRERDRVDLEGSRPGEGYRLLIEVLRESGPRANLTTWRLDVRREGADGAAWGIESQDILTTLDGLYRLALNPRRQIAVRDLAVSAEDLTLAVRDGTMFVAETEAGPTAYVVLGRGHMTFLPTPKTERDQLRVVVGSEALQTPFEVAFVRINPGDAGDRITAREMTEKAVDPRDLKRAEEIFRQEVGKSFGVELGDLSSDSWSMLPLAGDILAEIRTRRFDTLTYIRSESEVEDISLFDRRARHNISVYSSQEHLARFTRSYSEDGGADYVVKSYDVDVRYDPARRWIDGRTILTIETVAPSVSLLKFHLADSLAVRSVVSREFGRLLSVRVRGQNTVAVSLPTTLTKGYGFSVTVTYSGRLDAQEIDREAIQITPPAWQSQESAEEEIPLDESFLYSNRAYWYAQAPTLGYAPAAIDITVPEPWSVVASGSLQSVAAPPGLAPRGVRLRQFSFAANQPVRYLSFLVGRFAKAGSAKVPLRNIEVGPPAPRPPGVYYDEVDLTVQATPKQRTRVKNTAKSAENVLRFYTSLIGDFPYPALTVAAVDRRLPGGHSPAYLSVVALADPASKVRWADDPAALPRFPDFFLAHELAHEWWGQAVGWKNYHEHWLSEGFAQYFAALYAERSLGRGTFNAIIRSLHQWATDKSDQGPISLGYRIGHVKGDSRLFRAVIYDKGAMVLHMLRRLVGDQAFFAGLRRYYYTWRFQKAGTDDFRRAVEAESGLDLGRFFEQWIYGEHLPQVAFTSRLEMRGGATEAVLRFEQPGEVFDFAVTVTFEYPDNTTTDVVVKVTDRVVETRVAVKAQPRRIDVNRDLATLGVFQ